MEKLSHKNAAIRRTRTGADHVVASLGAGRDRLDAHLIVIADTMTSMNTKLSDVLIRLERGDARFEAHADRLRRLETVVYGAVGIICAAVFSALVYMVVKK